MPALTRAARKAAALIDQTTEPAPITPQDCPTAKDNSNKCPIASKPRNNDIEPQTENEREADRVPIVKARARGRPKTVQKSASQQYDEHLQLQRGSAAEPIHERPAQRAKENTTRTISPITTTKERITLQTSTSENNERRMLEKQDTCLLKIMNATMPSNAILNNNITGIHAVDSVSVKDNRSKKASSRVAEIEARLIPQAAQISGKVQVSESEQGRHVPRRDDQNSLRIKKTRVAVTRLNESGTITNATHDVTKTRDSDGAVQDKNDKRKISSQPALRVTKSSHIEPIVPKKKVGNTLKINKSRGIY